MGCNGNVAFRMNMGEIMKRKVLGISFCLAILATVGISVPALADSTVTTQDVIDPNSPIDPTTFSGNVIVATPQGEVVTHVITGQLEQRILDIRKAAAQGDLTTYATRTRGVGCGIWVYSIATPGGYGQSIDGCAVAGYPGYVRSYIWSNASDVTICTKGLGWSGGSAVWVATGCLGSSGQGQSGGNVAWGNVLAYTKMAGLSVSGVTGAAYHWRT